jgi:hypothetical protein
MPPFKFNVGQLVLTTYFVFPNYVGKVGRVRDRRYIEVNFHTDGSHPYNEYLVNFRLEGLPEMWMHETDLTRYTGRWK